MLSESFALAQEIERASVRFEQVQPQNGGRMPRRGSRCWHRYRGLCLSQACRRGVQRCDLRISEAAVEVDFGGDVVEGEARSCGRPADGVPPAALAAGTSARRRMGPMWPPERKGAAPSEAARDANYSASSSFLASSPVSWSTTFMERRTLPRPSKPEASPASASLRTSEGG